MYDMPHSYVWHNSFIWGIWFIHKCDMTHPYVWYELFTCVTWLVRIRNIWSIYISQKDTYKRDIQKRPTKETYKRDQQKRPLARIAYKYLFICVRCLIHTCDMLLSYVGCLKIYVSLLNIGLFYRSLLQKRPIFLSILLIVATPYVWNRSVFWRPLCTTCLVHIYHIYVWHDSFIHMTWLVHTCDVTCSYVWQDSFIYVTWFIHM